MIYSITQPYFDWSIIPVTMGLNGYSKMWIPWSLDTIKYPRGIAENFLVWLPFPTSNHQHQSNDSRWQTCYPVTAPVAVRLIIVDKYS